MSYVITEASWLQKKEVPIYIRCELKRLKWLIWWDVSTRNAAFICTIHKIGWRSSCRHNVLIMTTGTLKINEIVGAYDYWKCHMPMPCQENKSLYEFICVSQFSQFVERRSPKPFCYKAKVYIWQVYVTHSLSEQPANLVG